MHEKLDLNACTFTYENKLHTTTIKPSSLMISMLNYNKKTDINLAVEMVLCLLNEYARFLSLFNQLN